MSRTRDRSPAARLRRLSPDPTDPRPQGGLQEPEDPEAPPAAPTTAAAARRDPPGPECPGAGKLIPGTPPASCDGPSGRRFVAETFPPSGFLIVRLVAERALAEAGWLGALLEERLALEAPKGRPGVPCEGEKEQDGEAAGGEAIGGGLRDLECLAALAAAHPPTRLVLRLPPPQILELERFAARRAPAPLHSLATYWRLDARALPGPDADRMVTLLESLPAVDVAYREIAALDPAAAFSRSSQGYLAPAPQGIGAPPAAQRLAGAGAGVRLIDLEQGWLPRHQDLPPDRLLYGSNRHGDGPYRGDHGTAVLGELAAAGRVVGLAPGATLLRTSHYHGADSDAGHPPETAGHVADAVVAAVVAASVEPDAAQRLVAGTLERLEPRQLRPSGDVLLVEVQRGLAPTETDEADFDALRLATALGLVVVEAAGNGNLDLDRLASVTGERSLAPGESYYADSGAILVGAARSTLPHDRASFSNFGSRVDCYAWGEDVVTTGYGDLDDGDGEPQRSYTASFSGTSSAAPIVAGAAALLQAAAGEAGDRLSPAELRRRLADPATGTAQGLARRGAIGVMPDLGPLPAALGLGPRVYLRAGLGDRGERSLVPRRAGCPDILVLAERVADPARELAGDLAAPPAAVRARQGSELFVYTRLRNRGRGIARGAVTAIYAAEPAPLVPPEGWRLLGETAAVDVPQGELPVVAGPVRWPDARLPAGYLAVTRVPGVPELAATPAAGAAAAAGGLGRFCDFEEYLDFLALHPRRQVVEVARRSGSIELPFTLAGAFDRGRRFAFGVERRLPPGIEVTLAGPRDLILALAATTAAGRGGVEAGAADGDAQNGDDDVAQLRIPDRPRASLGPIRLPAGGDGTALGVPLRFRLRAPRNRLRDGHRLALIQLCDGVEVGRLTWRLAVPATPRPA